MRMKTLNNSSCASDPGGVRLSQARMERFHPELYRPPLLHRLLGLPYRGDTWWLTRHAEHLGYGDSRAAVVVAVDPLLVAAYTDELDCVATHGHRSRDGRPMCCSEPAR